MATSILSSILSPAKFRIYNKTTKTEISATFGIVKVMIRLSSEIQRHMLEDGTTLVDSRIVTPSKVMIDVLCRNDDELSSVVSLLQDRESLLQVTSRGYILDNLMVSTNYFHQSPEVLSATPTRISFDQVLVQNVNPIVFANSANASIVDKGLSSLTSITSSVSDLYNSVVKDVSLELSSISSAL